MARIPVNSIATEIDRLQSIIRDMDEQKQVLSDRQAEYETAIANLESTGLGEWEEVPDTNTVGEGAVE